MARIATRVRAKSRKRSKDPKMDWVASVLRPLASKQASISFWGANASRMDPLARPARFYISR